MKLIPLSQLSLLLGAVFSLSGSVAREGPDKDRAGCPDLSPFKECRMWGDFRMAAALEEGDPWLPDSIEKCQAMAIAMIATRDNASWAYEPSSGVVFGPPPPNEKQGWLQTVPLAMHVLEPLWTSDDWKPGQMALARSAQEFFAVDKGVPVLSFEEGRPEQNHEQLVALGEWFRQQMKSPEAYARMLLSTDDGPWLALDYDGEKVPEAKSEMEVGDAFELRLCPTDDPSPWLLQCVKDGKVTWSKVITQVEPDMELEFPEERMPAKLGSYGWMVLMHFGTQTDRGAAILYLDPDGELLFYFTMTEEQEK